VGFSGPTEHDLETRRPESNNLAESTAVKRGYEKKKRVKKEGEGR
jgi:hypothetical protein